MIHTLYSPSIGTSLVKLEAIEWLKSPGSKVKRGETVLILRFGKGYFDLMDIESFHDGYLTATLVRVKHIGLNPFQDRKMAY